MNRDIATSVYTRLQDILAKNYPIGKRLGVAGAGLVWKRATRLHAHRLKSRSVCVGLVAAAILPLPIAGLVGYGQQVPSIPRA